MSERHVEIKIECDESGYWSAALCYRDGAGVTTVDVSGHPTLLALDADVLSVIRDSRTQLGDDHAKGALGEWRKATAKAREMAA